MVQALTTGRPPFIQEPGAEGRTADDPIIVAAVKILYLIFQNILKIT